jgi:hypothetical protein
VDSAKKAAEDVQNKAKEAADGVQGKLNEAKQSVEGAAGGDGDWSFNSMWAKAQEAAQNAQKAALDVSISCLEMLIQCVGVTACFALFTASCNQATMRHH